MLKILLVYCSLLSLAYGSDVLELTDNDFDTEMSTKDIALVKFYAPWCGHCKRLAPEFEKAATKLLSSEPPVHLVKVDCTNEKKTCEKYEVGGYPTLKIFRKGQLSQDYEGERSADGIIKYMVKQSGPAALELKSKEEFDKFVSRDDFVTVGFFESESKLKDSFFKVADTERDRFTFGYITDEVLLKTLTYNDDIVVYVPKKLHNKFEPGEVKYDGNYDTDKIKEFLLFETNGLAGIRAPENMYQYTRQPLVVVYCKLDYVKDPKGSNYWRNRVLKVAESYKRKVNFAVSNKDDFNQEMVDYGLSDRAQSDKPAVAAQTKDGKFFMDKEFSVENLKQFVEDLLKGKLEPYFKSEPVPDSQGDVKVVVARNYKELIGDANSDVLIEFYAPWCGHCKKLAPIYDELGAKMAKENVIIAKMDATANDVPKQFEVRGFPTLYWVPKNGKDMPVRYEGGRELDDFVKYIAKHSTDGLQRYSRDGKKKKTAGEL